MGQRQVRVRPSVSVAAVVLFLGSACNPNAVLGGNQTVNTGKVRSLTSERVCISSRTPDGPGEKCFRMDDDTQMPGGAVRGDLVEVRFEGLVANEVRPVPPH